MSNQLARALIVEDDRSWQQILGELLTDIGLEIDIAHDLESAQTALRASSHHIAIVDLALGEGDLDNQDGLLVLQAIRRQDPGCVALMLTGFATVELAVSVLGEYGALTCLRKETFNREEFRDWVHQALAVAPTRTGRVDSSSVQEPDPASDLVSSNNVASPFVLVVEDDAGWRQILAELLIDANYVVQVCSSYGEALGCLRRQRIALAVVDLSLIGSSRAADEPDEALDGYRLLAYAREYNVPAIVVSGVASTKEIENAFAQEGIFAYLQKQTFDRQAFLQTVNEAWAICQAGQELADLTERERQVLGLLAQGVTNKEIAAELVITTNTVKRHLKAIFTKLDVHTRAAAAAKALGAGITS